MTERVFELGGDSGAGLATAAEIAARAGVNGRTFFRHFPDKREVLFDGEADLRVALMQAIVEAPESLEPFEALLCAFRKSARNLENNRRSPNHGGSHRGDTGAPRTGAGQACVAHGRGGRGAAAARCL